MSALAVVTEPTSLVAVHDQCSQLEAWAERCESVPELKDASNKLAAIDEYLARTSTEGRARVAAARRRLEVRIGKLLGPPQTHGPGRGKPSTGVEVSLTRHERTKFRAMASHEDVVEAVIAEADDDYPASRKRVLRVIKGDEPVKADMPSSVGSVRSLPRTKSPEFILRNIAERLDGTSPVLESLDLTEVDADAAAELADTLSSFRSVLSKTINQLRSRA